MVPLKSLAIVNLLAHNNLLLCFFWGSKLATAKIECNFEMGKEKH